MLFRSILGSSYCSHFFLLVGGAAAGNLTPVPGYFAAIRKVCDKYGVLLVLDEVRAFANKGILLSADKL